jgi:hypothetical protein
MRLGVDLGGTKIEIIALDNAGRERLRRRIPTPRGDYPAIIGAVTELVAGAERELGARARVGIGTPGAVSPATGLMKNANSVVLNARPLKEDLERALGREIRMANDANCFALSEATDGAGAGAGVVFGVILGTGTGAGMVVGAQVLTGPNAIAGEWGHNPLFEGYRTPERQRYLYSKGRTRPGPRVSNAKPWQSLHQYGVAGDFVLYLDGGWSWSTSGIHGRWWDRLHELGTQVGLRPLTWEKPHLQLEGVALSDLRNGRYPEGGDQGWAENLEDAIVAWSGSPAAPPAPTIVADRPPLDEAEEGIASEPVVDADMVAGGRYRVIARNGLRLREGPGTQYDVIGELGDGQIVHRLAVDGDWIKVDSEGDGLADGFCHGAYLLPV